MEIKIRLQINNDRNDGVHVDCSDGWHAMIFNREVPEGTDIIEYAKAIGTRHALGTGIKLGEIVFVEAQINNTTPALLVEEAKIEEVKSEETNPDTDGGKSPDA